MSPSVWWDEYSILSLIEAWTPARRPRIWLDTGTAEGNNPDKVAADAQLMRDALLAKGVDLRYEEAPGHQHNEAAWSARFPAMLEYLFPAKLSPARYSH
jgi:predicted alpha/beta superfamily hydrolase